MANPAKQGLKRQKLLDLDLKVLKEEKQVVSPQKKACFSSSKLELPAELPSVEEQLKVLAAALKAFSFLEAWRWNLRRVKDCANSYVSKKEKSLL